MAAVFLLGSNQSVYAELMRDYRKDFANQDNNYPKSVQAMVDVMRQLKPKDKKKTRNTSNTIKEIMGSLGKRTNQKKKVVLQRRQSVFATANLDTTVNTMANETIWCAMSGLIDVESVIILKHKKNRLGVRTKLRFLVEEQLGQPAAQKLNGP